MKKCKSCQKEINAKAKKCPYCQSDQRNWFMKHKIITTILILIVLGMIGSSGNGSKSNNQTTGESGAFGQTWPKPTNDPYPHFENGTYEVGKDLKPGTYRTRVGSSGCYYARLSGFGGGLGEIIANENADNPAVVTIEESDKGFKSTRCGTWTQDLSQITKSKTTFEDGTYIVGTDIQPGRYKSKGQSGCYYARLAGFGGGGVGEIISNENTDTAAIVTIAESDKGFKSTRCGTWTLQE